MFELYSTIDFNYLSCTGENLKRFKDAYAEWLQRLSWLGFVVR